MSDQTPPTGDDPTEPPASPPSYGAPTPPPASDGPPAYPSYPSEPGDAGAAYGSPPPPSGPAYDPGTIGPQPYRIGDAFSTGFRLFGKNAVPFILIVVAIGVAVVIFGALSYATSDHQSIRDSDTFSFNSSLTPVSLIFSLLSSVVSTLLSAALVRGALDAVDGKQVTFEGMFAGWDKVQVLIASLIISVLTLIGTLAFIIPGLIVAFLLWYTNFFIVDRREAAFEGVVDSARFTGGHVGALLLTAIVAFLVNIVGICLCGVGLLVSLPVTMIMAACAYRQLQGRPIATGE